MERLKNRKIILKMGVLAILAIFIIPNFFAIQVSAQTLAPADEKDYTVLAPLPGTTEGACDPSKTTYEAGNPACKTTLERYLPAIFKLAIGLSAVAAVLMIVIGGFQYISSDAITGKNAGRERIKNAVFGLVLVIGAWLILNEINPNLLEINLNIEPAITTGPPGGRGELSTPGKPMTTEEIAASNTIRESLKLKGIETYRPPCESGLTTGCVNLNGLSGTTISGLEKLAQTLCPGSNSFCLSITGGTEGGHSATGDHPKGNAVDFALSQSFNSKILPYLTNQLTNKKATSQTTKDGELITITDKSSPLYGATFLNEGNLWHVVPK